MKKLVLMIFIVLLQACSSTPQKALPMAKNVDLKKFMGDWYVIANAPTFIEAGAHNAIETYEMNKDGSINTTFKFNEDAFDGELKIYNPTGFVSKDNNSVWVMQFIWPFEAEYIIAYLSKDYQHTIIARSARDYVWVMSRTPVVTNARYQSLIKRCIDMGYTLSQIKKIPHQIKPSTKPAEGEK